MSELGQTPILKRKLTLLGARNPAVSSDKVDAGIHTATRPDGHLRISGTDALRSMQISGDLNKVKKANEKLKLPGA